VRVGPRAMLDLFSSCPLTQLRRHRFALCARARGVSTATHTSPGERRKDIAYASTIRVAPVNKSRRHLGWPARMWGGGGGGGVGGAEEGRGWVGAPQKRQKHPPTGVGSGGGGGGRDPPPPPPPPSPPPPPPPHPYFPWAGGVFAIDSLT